MAFEQTSRLKKTKLFAFLSVRDMRQNDEITNSSLLNAAKYMAQDNIGTEPIYVVGADDLNISPANPPQSILYVVRSTADIDLNLSYVGKKAFVVFNDSDEYEINVKVGETSPFALQCGDSCLVNCYGFLDSTDIIVLQDIIPYGFTTEDLSIKESKGDEIKTSMMESIVTSKVVEVVVPSFETIEYSAVSGAYSAWRTGIFNSFDSMLGKVYGHRYLLIVEIPDGEVESDGYTSSTNMFQIDLSLGIKIEQEFVANNPNKSTLTFKQDVGLDSEILAMLYNPIS